MPKAKKSKPAKKRKISPKKPKKRAKSSRAKKLAQKPLKSKAFFLKKENIFRALGVSGITALLFLIPFQDKNNFASPTPPITSAHEEVVASPSPTTTPLPQKSANAPDLFVTAKSALVIDLDTNSVLYQKSPDLRLMPASTTKIMTALVAFDQYQIDQVITISQEENTIGQTMKLVSGEQITVENLLYGLLVSSGNDAALALAMAYPSGGYAGFVQAMNTKAQSLGLENTNFTNVAGFEGPDHTTTVADLAVITKEALNNPTLKTMIATNKILVSSTDGVHEHLLNTTNQLLGKVPGVYGVKTGWTQNAMECLVTAVDRDGKQIITVVLGSQNRFQDSQNLIEWTYANYTW
jgi:D-alanyl-D-alanine carboxypeptidase